MRYRETFTEGKVIPGVGRKRREVAALPIKHVGIEQMLEYFCATKPHLNQGKSHLDLWNIAVSVVQEISGLPLEKLKTFVQSVWMYGYLEETLHRIEENASVDADQSFKEVFTHVTLMYGGQRDILRRVRQLETRFTEGVVRPDIGRKRPARFEPIVKPRRHDDDADVWGYLNETFGRAEALRLWNLIATRLIDITGNLVKNALVKDVQHFSWFMQSERMREVVTDAIRRAENRGSTVGDEISLLLAGFGRSALIRFIIQSAPSFKMVDEARMVPGVGGRKPVRPARRPVVPDEPRYLNTRFLNRLLYFIQHAHDVGNPYTDDITALNIWRETMMQIIEASGCTVIEAMVVLEHITAGTLASHIMNALDVEPDLQSAIGKTLKSWTYGDIAGRVRSINGQMG